MRKTIYLYLVAVLSIANSCTKDIVIDATDINSLNKVIESEFKAKGYVGLAYVAIKNDSVVFSGAKGFADVSKHKAFTLKTIMPEIASVSKTIIATAIMQLQEQGLINLEADINNYLPFSVSNPNFPSIKISVKMLLTHTSSISDGGYKSTFYLYGYGDYPQTLTSFMKDYLLYGGQYYTHKSFSNTKPGEKYSYSNVGSALLGSAVEYITGISYNTYCKEKIFQPLGMNSTSFFFSEIPKEQVAIPYTLSSQLNPPNPFYSYPDYPNGQLKTTIEDLSKFLMAIMNNGTYKTVQILQPQSVLLMLQDHLGGDIKQGLIFYPQKIGDKEYWTHGGGDPGVSTELYFDPVTKTGAIIFANATLKNSTPILNSLLKYANK